MCLKRCVAVGCLGLALASGALSAGATTDEERGFLALYFSDEELEVFSTTRSLKSIAGIAEDVAVVTAEDIERSHAHTVAEALYNVTGIEMADFKGPGSGGVASVLGSGRERVVVMLDGVALNAPMNDFQLATLPVQMIRKIEIVRGPASSTWGSSFGGVINVLTKSAPSADRVGGTVSASFGTADTSDVRAELSARKGRLGIYLYGGRMDSDGLRDAHPFTHENFFGKLSLDAGLKTRLDLSFRYHNSDSVNTVFPSQSQDVAEGFTMETLSGKADLRTSLADTVDLALSAWRLRNDDNFYQKQLNTDVMVRDAPVLFDRYGFSGSLAWRTRNHALVAGADATKLSYEEGFAAHSAIDQQKYALFVNDTASAGNLTVTPGLRYDHSTLAGGLASPSLGATYLASRDLLFRALVSRGFHDPAIVKYLDAPAFGYAANQDITPEKIWSYQAGVEANVADLLRAKLTLFYHDIDDILVEKSLGPGKITTENGGRARTTGGEFEVATNAVKGFVFTSGVHYEQVRLIDFSDPRYANVRDIYGVNAALAYDGKDGLTGAVKAHYLWLDMTEQWQPDSRGVVVDLFGARKFAATGGVVLEVFASVHNIFNAHSYSEQVQKNPGRWLEAGVRCSF
jgi:vitamin B12 transporter